VQVFEKHICVCDAIGISTIFSSFFFLNWHGLVKQICYLVCDCCLQSVFRTPLTCYDALIMFHQEALPHPSRTLFQPEVHSKGDHISKMRLRANQAFLFISASEDSLGKHAEGWKNMVFMV
jgi:hypothetical protein